MIRFLFWSFYFFLIIEIITTSILCFKRSFNFKDCDGNNFYYDEESLKPYRKKINRDPTHEDREKLLQIPIRKISQFDIDKNKEEIEILEESLEQTLKSLKNVKKFTIQYLKSLLEKFGADFPRKTKIRAIEEIDRKAIETREVKVGFDPKTFFIGTKVTGALSFVCTNFDKLLVICKDGTFKVINIAEKQYVENAAFVTVADKKTPVNCVYFHKKTGECFAKRFVVEKFLLDKAYRFFDEGMQLIGISLRDEGSFEVETAEEGKSKSKKKLFAFKDMAIKGALIKGSKVIKQKVKKVIFNS